MSPPAIAGYSSPTQVTRGTFHIQAPFLTPGQLMVQDDRSRFKVVAAGRRWGKALDLDTPLPTPEGWTTMGEVQTGQQVLDHAGHPTSVIGATEVQRDRACYDVTFSDGSVITADAEHLWSFNSPAGDRAITVQTTDTQAAIACGWKLPDGSGRTMRGIARVPTRPVRCIAVDNPHRLYLAGRTRIPTHNTRYGALSCMAEALEGRRSWWVAPTYQIAQVGWREIRRMAQRVPQLCKIREGDRRIEVVNGGWLQVRSAHDPDSLRGEGLDYVVLDEAAYIQEQAWTEALRPTLSDRRGRALFISSPSGAENWFHRLFLMGQTDNRDWQSWAFPTRTNPMIDPREIAEARGTLPELIFAQEYLAQFIADAGAVFRNIDACAIALPQERAIEEYINELSERVPGHRYIMGVDIARRVDFSVCSILDMSQAVPTQVFQDRFNQIDWEIQIQRILANVEKFKVEHLIVDQTGIGDPIVERLRRRLANTRTMVEGVQLTNASKTNLVESLMLGFENESIHILNEKTLVTELRAFKATKTRSGLTAYNAPPGMHDDTVIALALAYAGAAIPQELTVRWLGGDD